MAHSTTPVDWALELMPSARCFPAVQHLLAQSARAAAHAHGATVVWLEDGMCYYADEDTMSPLWRGQRFPAEKCISGWAMMHDQSVVVSDISTDERIPLAAYRPTFVRSLAMVPIRAPHPVGAIGAYWATNHIASAEELAALERLAGAAGRAMVPILRRATLAVG